jgi:hypothetical protein
MATSGTVTHRTNRDEISKGALRLCSAYDPENSAGPTSTQLTLAAEALNLMVKAWAAHGLHLWERKYGVIFPSTQTLFVLGSPGPGGDHACLSTPLGSGFMETTLSAAAASAATTISVTSTSGGLGTVGSPAFSITDTYTIGVELDSGSIQWNTVSGAPSGTTVTLGSALTGAAASGNRVFCYQTKLTRPLRILDGFVRNLSSDTDSRVNLISREEYGTYGAKTPTTTGTPYCMTYEPRANTGHLYIYPAFVDKDQLLFIEFQSHIEDFSSSTDDYDLPQEWGECLKFNLAYRLALEYEVPEEKFRAIERMAINFLDLVKGYDQENSSVFFGVSEG